MRICAYAREAELARALDTIAPLPEAEQVRAPEHGAGGSAGTVRRSISGRRR